MNDREREYLERQRTYWNERARQRTRHQTGAVGYLRPLEIGLTSVSLRGRTALDAGCGDGAVAAWCKRLRPRLRVSGIDYSDAMVERARARGINAIVGDIVELPWPDREFASAFAVRSVKNVLDEFDQARALGELARVSDRRVVVVDSIKSGDGDPQPEFNLYPTEELVVASVVNAGFRLAWSMPLRDWHWLARRGDRFGNERIFVFERATG